MELSETQNTMSKILAGQELTADHNDYSLQQLKDMEVAVLAETDNSIRNYFGQVMRAKKLVGKSTVYTLEQLLTLTSLDQLNLGCHFK